MLQIPILAIRSLFAIDTVLKTARQWGFGVWYGFFLFWFCSVWVFWFLGFFFNVLNLVFKRRTRSV